MQLHKGWDLEGYVPYEREIYVAFYKNYLASRENGT